MFYLIVLSLPTLVIVIFILKGGKKSNKFTINESQSDLKNITSMTDDNPLFHDGNDYIGTNPTYNDDENSKIKNTASDLTNNEIEEFVRLEIENKTTRLDSQFCFDSNIKDPLFGEAARIIVSTQKGSTHMLQRQLKLGSNRAGRIMDQLESSGIVGGFNGARDREVLVDNLQTLENEILMKELRFNENKKNLFANKYSSKYREYIDNEVKKYYELKEEKRLEQLKETLRYEIIEKERKRLKKEERLKIKEELVEELKQKGELKNNLTDKRSPISQDVQDLVWNRDDGKCVKCGSNKKLEFDHIIPFSKGGSNTYRNIQLLCEQCNRKKSNKIG